MTVIIGILAAIAISKVANAGGIDPITQTNGKAGAGKVATSASMGNLLAVVYGVPARQGSGRAEGAGPSERGGVRSERRV